MTGGGILSAAAPRREREHRGFRKNSIAYVFERIGARLIIVLLPLIPLLHAGMNELPMLIKASAVQLSVSVSVVLWAVAEWRHDLHAIKMGAVWRRSGLVFEREDRLCAYRLSGTEITRSLLLRVLGLARISARTAACAGKPEFSMLVSRRRAARISRILTPLPEIRELPRFTASRWRLALAAASESNFYSGLLLILPIVNSTGKVLGISIPERLYGEVEGMPILAFMPRLFSAAALALIIGYGVHFLYTFIGNLGFTALRGGQYIVTRSGALTKHFRTVNCARVSAVDVRLTLFTLLLGIRSASIIAQGHSRPVPLIPAARARELEHALMCLLPKPPGESARTRPDTGRRAVYYAPWLTALAAVLVMGVRLFIMLAPYRRLIVLLFLPPLVLLAWRAGIGGLCAGRAHISLSGECVEIEGVSGLSIHCLRIFRGRVADVRIRRGFFQRRLGLCSIRLRAKGTKKGIWCRNLPYERANAIAERIR